MHLLRPATASEVLAAQVLSRNSSPLNITPMAEAEEQSFIETRPERLRNATSLVQAPPSIQDRVAEEEDDLPGLMDADSDDEEQKSDEIDEDQPLSSLVKQTPRSEGRARSSRHTPSFSFREQGTVQGTAHHWR